MDTSTVIYGIQEKILHEVRAAKYYSVCADEASDVANKEQLSLILRFVDQAGFIREEFISFFLCEYGTTGEAIWYHWGGNIYHWGGNIEFNYKCSEKIWAGPKISMWTGL